MQTQEKPSNQRSEAEKRYQLSVSLDGRGEIFLYMPSDGESDWIQPPFKDGKSPTFLTIKTIEEIAAGDPTCIWKIYDEQGNCYPFIPPAIKTYPVDLAAGQPTETKQERTKQETSTPQQPPTAKFPAKLAQGGWLGKAAIWTMAGLLCLVLIAVAAINIHPFVQFLSMMAAQIGLTNDLENIPILKDVGAMFGVSALVLIAFCWWAVMQLMELSPQIVASNGEKILERAEVYSSKSRSFSTTDSNLEWLKKKEAKKHGDAVAYFRAARLVVYAIETFVVMTVTNPVKGGGGFGAFLLYLISFQWGKINWGVIALLLSVLFLVEIIFRTIRHLKTLGKTL